MTEISEEQQQVILEFVFESKETLESLEMTLIRLEEDTSIDTVKDTMNLIFRPFHSMKGGAGFLQLENIGRVTHTAENLLQLFRTNPDKWHHGIVELLIQSSDLIREMLAQVESDFHDKGFDQEVERIIDLLKQQYQQLSSQPDPSREKTSDSLPSAEGVPTTSLSQTLKDAAEILHSQIQSHWQQIEESGDSQKILAVLQELILHYHQTNSASGSNAAPDNLFYLPESVSEIESSPTDDDMEAGDKLKTFADTTLEHLENIEGVFLVLEKIPGDIDQEEYFQSAMRSFHSIKGNAGFLEQNDIERISHKTENLILAMQEKKIPLDEAVTTLILRIVDALRSAVTNLAEGKEIAKDQIHIIESALTSMVSADDPTLLGNILVKMGTVDADDIDEAVKKQKAPLGDVLVEMGKATAADIGKALDQQKVEKTAQKNRPTSSNSLTKMRDIRVSLSKLDQLFDLVGELIISESMISRHTSLNAEGSESIKIISGQLHRNMRNLQDIVMSIRMVPMSSLFRKMVRVVHDASRKLDKKVKLELIGEKTEVDKTLVELITDPLLHIIRNAMDHGIESNDERAQTGKPFEGKVILEAKHVGNEVWIMIKDDGKGMSKDKIIERAIEKGIITSETQFESDSEIWKLIFEPGFSTAETVTDFSGRGVGMDVVKRNIEKLRGQIDVDSKLGSGSTFTLKIPLTLSIIDGLLVRIGSSSYAIPTVSIKETLQPLAKSIVKTMDGSEMLRLRNRMHPVIRLHRIYGLRPDFEELSDGMLLIIENEGQSFCLFVDEVLGQQQIVVKNLPESMNEAPHLSGCTILGNGEVGLIMDANSLVKSLIKPKKAQ